MGNQKRLAIATTVIACFLLAVPVLASGAVWKHEGVNLTKFIELTLPGGELFESEIAGEWGGMSCGMRATMTTEGGSTAKITKYEPQGCFISFGKMINCEVSTEQAKGLPWSVEVKSTDLVIKNLRVRRTFKAGCPVSEFDKTIASTTVTLNTPSAMSEWTLKGAITNYNVFGIWKIEGANAGTYGIG